MKCPYSGVGCGCKEKCHLDLIRMEATTIRTTVIGKIVVKTRKLASATACECCLGRWFRVENGRRVADFHTEQEAIDAHITWVELEKLL